MKAIDANADLTQRRLAARMGIALGMANSYLKRCVRTRLIEVKQAPANRYSYYLTPRGVRREERAPR